MKFEQARNSGLLIVSNILINLSNFLRQIILAWFLGVSDKIDILLVAQIVPAILQAMVGGGAGETSVIKGGERSRNNNSFMALFISVCLLCIIILGTIYYFLLDEFLPIFKLSSESSELFTNLSIIFILNMLPGTFTSILRPHLYAKGLYSFFTYSSVLSQIAGVLFILLTMNVLGIYSFALSIIISNIINAIWFSFRADLKYSEIFKIGIWKQELEHLILLFKRVISVSLQTIVNHLGTFWERTLSLRNLPGGYLSSLNYSKTLSELPNSVLLSSVLTTSYIEQVNLHKKDFEEFRKFTGKTLTTIISFGLFFQIIMLAFAPLIIIILFRRGNFDNEAVKTTLIIFNILTIGFLPRLLYGYFARTMYILGSYRQVLFAGIIRLIIHVSIMLLFIKDFTHTIPIAILTGNIFIALMLFYMTSEKLKLEKWYIFFFKIIGIIAISMIMYSIHSLTLDYYINRSTTFIFLIYLPLILLISAGILILLFGQRSGENYYQKLRNMSEKGFTGKNRKYLRRVFMMKRVFLPILILIDKVGLVKPFETVFNSIIRKLGVNKNIHYFFKYRDFARYFKNEFKSSSENNGVVLFPMQTSVNGNIPLVNLLFSKFLAETERLNPVFLVCNSVLPKCSKDGMLKSRSAHPLFCYECWNGYKHISDKTGIEVSYFSDFKESSAEELNNLKNKLVKIENVSDFEKVMFGEVPVGKFCRKSVLRYLLKGKLENSSEERDLFSEFIISASIYSQIIDNYLNLNPRVKYMIIHNGTLAFESIARFHAQKRKINYMTFETFLGQNSLIYRKNGEVMTLDWSDYYEDFCKTFELNKEAHDNAEGFFSSLKSGAILYSVLNKDHIPDRIENAGRYVALFTNMNFDTAVLDRNGIFESMEEWIFSVIDFWIKNVVDIKLVIRIHPAELKLITASKEFMAERIRQKAGNSNKIIIVGPEEKINSYELIKSMEYGLVYASTIGLEIAYNDKRCVVAGIPYFRNKPFLISPETRENYFATLNNLNRGDYDFSIDKAELIRTVNFVYFNRMKRLTGIKVYTPKEENFTIYSNSDEMVRNNLSFFEDFRNELFAN